MTKIERVSGAVVGVWGIWSLTLILALCWIANDAFARPKQLSSIEVEDLIKGNTVFGYNPSDDSNYTMFHSGDGGVRAELRDVNGEKSLSDGKWWITDDGKLCLEWDNFHWVNSCVFVVRDNEALTFQDDNGRVVSFGEVEIGNPDDI